MGKEIKYIHATRIKTNCSIHCYHKETADLNIHVNTFKTQTCFETNVIKW